MVHSSLSWYYILAFSKFLSSLIKIGDFVNFEAKKDKVKILQKKNFYYYNNKMLFVKYKMY